MAHPIRSHLTSTNVMVTVLVLVVLGGGASGAASKIGPKGIKKNAGPSTSRTAASGPRRPLVVGASAIRCFAIRPPGERALLAPLSSQVKLRWLFELVQEA